MAYLKLKNNNSDLEYSDDGTYGRGGGGGGSLGLELEEVPVSPDSRGGRRISAGSGLTILDHIKRSAGSTPAKNKNHLKNTIGGTKSSTLRGDTGRAATTASNDNHNQHSYPSLPTSAINHDVFSTSLTASTSVSTDDYTEGDFALFQTSQSSSNKEEDGPDSSSHDDATTDDDDKYESYVHHDHAPFETVNSMDEQFGQNFQQPPSPQRIAGHHHVSRTTRLLHGLSSSASSGSFHRTSNGPEHAVKEFLSPQSQRTNEDDEDDDESTCWAEDGGNRVSSLFDNQTQGGEEEDNYTMATVEEGNETEDGGITDEGDDEDDGDDDEDDDDDYTYAESQLTGLDDRPLNAVESFLDELAEVDDIHQLRKLLFQVGSCHFSDNMNATVDDSVEDYSKTVHNVERRRENAANGHLGSGTVGDSHDAFTVQRRNLSAGGGGGYRAAATTPQYQQTPQQTATDRTVMMEDELQTVDSFSLNQIFQNWSLQADTLMEIVTNSTILSQATDDEEEKNTSSATGSSTQRHKSNAAPMEGRNQENQPPPPKMTAMSFLSSMFGCQQGGSGYF